MVLQWKQRGGTGGCPSVFKVVGCWMTGCGLVVLLVDWFYLWFGLCLLLLFSIGFYIIV